MHPSVDKTSTPLPSTDMSTTGNTSEPSTAHLLIMESIMRITTAFLFTSLVACVGNVGGDTGRSRTPTNTENEPDGECEKVETDVTIRSAADFDTLPDGCWDLWASLTLQGTSITSLSGLGKLVAVNDLTLVGTNLTTLDAQPFSAYGAVTISGNAQLRDLKNLTIERADDLAVDVTIDGNPELGSLDGLVDIKTIDGDLLISNNAKLGGAAFRKLTTVGGSVRVSNNGLLTSLDLGAVTSLGALDISSNAALATFTGPSAAQLDGDFTVRGNRALRDLGSMSSLNRVVGNVTVDNNAALATVSLPATMQYVTGTFTISNNAALTELGTQTPRLVGMGAINISSNGQLDFCEAHEVDHCVQQHGAVTIANNKQQSANNCECWCQD
jgi:hypothetical protein